jgi:hypothetical protein
VSGPEYGSDLPDVVVRAGDVMSATGQQRIRLYATSAIEELLEFAQERDIPELAGRCDKELAARRRPPPGQATDCRHCREPIRRVRPDDGPGPLNVGDWVHVVSGSADCGITLRAAPVVEGPGT